jgi:hypothetical protein
MVMRHHSEIDWSVDGVWCTFFMIIRRLIIYSIDIKWIMPKEFIDGPLDHTRTFICRNTGERILRPPIWIRPTSDVYI